ncbi:MAG: hypothetical protein ACOZFS_15145 [Thermodesulfobacteriota bacterium]
MLTPDLNKIPPELKAFRQWVCYRSNKIPVNPKTGDNAKADDPDTWGEFDQVVRHWEAHRGNGIAGIGFEFSSGDPYTGVDLDKCRDLETGVIEPWAQEIIDRLQSYTEFSPSGSGLHILVRGKLPPGGNRKGQIEMYDSARYFTMTGHHLEGTSLNIEPRQAQLEALHYEIFGKSSEQPKQNSDRPTKETPDELSDDELINKICKSKIANKFRDLWRGDIDYLKYQYRYASASEADLALCLILAFWTGKSPGWMDRLFRKSKLMRPKWDEYRGELTYGQKTIEKAIAETTEVWKGAKKKRPAKQGNKTSASEKTGLPVIQINNRQLRDTTALAINALQAANAPPKLFMRMGQLCQIKIDEDERPSIEIIKETDVKYYLTQAADFIRKGDEVTNVSPPKILAQTILATPNLPFPPLRGIVEVPVLRPGGSILTEPGYDPDTKLYYHPLPGTTVDTIISASPDQQDAINSVNFILHELLPDFPFVDDASRANTLAALLTPIVRHVIVGPVPMGLFDAPQAGTGKTKLVEIIGMISTGRWTPMRTPPMRRDDDAEWSKVITSALLKGSTINCFDNIDGVLRSASLCLALTSQVYSDRLLGTNQQPEIPVICSWFATGNNIQLGGDLPRRCYWVRLDAKVSQPWKRSDFRHKDLEGWVTENRSRLSAALLTMARAWYVAGQPESDSPILGSYQAWCRTVGGILKFSGIEGFLGNLDAMHDRADLEGREWEAFLGAWHDHYGDGVVLVKELVEETQKEEGSALRDALPSRLAEAMVRKGSFAKSLGRALQIKEGVHFGDLGLHLVRVPEADKKSKANGWQVLTY